MTGSHCHAAVWQAVAREGQRTAVLPVREHCHSWCWLKRSRKCHGKPCSYCILPGKVKINQTSMHILDLHKTMANDLQKDDVENPAIWTITKPCKIIGDPLTLRTFLGEPQILTVPYFCLFGLASFIQDTVSFSSFVLFGSCNYLQMHEKLEGILREMLGEVRIRGIC